MHGAALILMLLAAFAAGIAVGSAITLVKIGTFD